MYLIINSATGYFKEKNGEKYLILDSTGKYEEFFSGIVFKIKTLNSGKELFYEKKYARIGINTDNDLPKIIRCVLQKDEKLYPQIYLNEFLYESVI